MGSPERQGLCSPEPPANVPSRQAIGILGLSLLAMALSCWFLLIQVGWDPSLIFDFIKLVRIYFFFVYVLFQLM